MRCSKLLFGHRFFGGAFFIAALIQCFAATLPHDVYVWQRDWNESVRTAVTRHATNFQTIVALAAEISWRDRQPVSTRLAIHHAALRDSQSHVGLALRIGPYPGPFRSNDAVTTFIIATAKALLAESRSNQLRIAEFQIDFDCADSKLAGYRLWVESLRAQIAPVPLVITALPSWLNQKSFPALAAATDGYVLQVHSLEKPKSFDAPFTLCDPAAARRAMERAGTIGVPFRVALPTYGYYVGFNSSGAFIGLAADGPSIHWPQGTRIREVRSDAVALAQLTAFWQTNHPAALRGFIWYRLPTENENLNWRFATLGVVMSGRVPQADLKVEIRSPEPELAEVILRNNGSADFQNAASIRVRAPGARVLASDAVGGFGLSASRSGDLVFRTQAVLMRPGEARVIGWLRTDRKAEVQFEFDK